MEERAAIPVTLPLSYTQSTKSYWQDPSDPFFERFSGSLMWSEGDGDAEADGGVVRAEDGKIVKEADTVIVGSGITGACVAYEVLKRREKKRSEESGKKSAGRNVVMLEARKVCSGATGRNGGHTKAASYRSFAAHAQSEGIAEAVKIAKLEYENIRATHALARQLGIECDSWEGETVDVFFDQTQFEHAIEAVKIIRDAASADVTITGDGSMGEGKEWAEYHIWKEKEVKERFGCAGDGIVGGVSYYAGSIHGYKFVTGLLKVCLKMGLRLYTETPVLGLTRRGDEDGKKWLVETTNGSIHAEKVILATNAYTSFLRSDFQGSIVPLRGQVTVQRPGLGEVSSLNTKLAGSYSFIYKEGYDYMIRRPVGAKDEGDFVIGGGLTKADQDGLYQYGTTDDGSLNPDISSYLQRSLPLHFGEEVWGGDHVDGRVKREWSGIMGYSPDGYPFVGAVGDDDKEAGLWVCAGFQGHGMVLCLMCAKAVVSMVVGEKEGSDEVYEWFPKAWKVSKERLEKKFKGRLHVSGGE